MPPLRWSCTWPSSRAARATPLERRNATPPRRHPSTEAALACIDAFARPDSRRDLAEIDVPTLVLHGAGDEIVPIDVSGRRTAELVAGSRLVVVEDGPHGINDSHTEEFNQALLEFLGSL